MIVKTQCQNIKPLDKNRIGQLNYTTLHKVKIVLINVKLDFRLPARGKWEMMILRGKSIHLRCLVLEYFACEHHK